MAMYDLIIIGGGVSGMQAALTASDCGMTSIIIEQSDSLGGMLTEKHTLFSNFELASDLISRLEDRINEKISRRLEISLNSKVINIDKTKTEVTYERKDTNGNIENITINSSTIILATGYSYLDASQKPEYGYGVLDNVITYDEMEQKIKSNTILTSSGQVPSTVAFIHCVGSRDTKAGNKYCSKLCCAAGVKQGIDLCKSIEGIKVYNFYTDMRLYGHDLELMYREGMSKHKINYIRGRVSKISPMDNSRLSLEAEDTLISTKLSLSADIVVLLTGTCGNENSIELSKQCGIKTRHNGFMVPLNIFEQTTQCASNNIFMAGFCESPMDISESINHATLAVHNAKKFIKQ